MRRDYVLVAVAILVPSSVLIGLVVLSPRGDRPANDSHVGTIGSAQEPTGNSVQVPVGRFFLIRNGRQHAAVKLTNAIRDGDGGYEYLWYWQSDDSGVFTNDTAKTGKGKVFENYRGTKDKDGVSNLENHGGILRIDCNGLTVEWSMGNWIYFHSPWEKPSDAGDVEIALTDQTRIENLNFLDKTLVWHGTTNKGPSQQGVRADADRPGGQPTGDLGRGLGAAAEPQVDMFGKKLDAFAKEVVEKQGIAGEVVMAGRPVPGAKVVMRRVLRKIPDGVRGDFPLVVPDPPDGQEWTADTDGEGKFAFYGLQAGHYGLEAYTDTACGVDDMPVRPNSIPGARPGRIAYNAGRGHMSIELRPSAPLIGRVLDSDGEPVADAIVYPTRVQYENDTVALDPVPVVLLGVKTGPDGAFRFPRLVAGRWQLAVRAGGFPDQTSDWLSTGDQPAEIRLNK